MLFVGTSIIHPSTEGVFLLCNILDLLIYRSEFILIDKGKIIEEISDRELNDRCKRHIAIKATDPQKALIVLEETLHTDSFKLMPDGIIRLYDYLDDMEKVAAALSDAHILVTGLSVAGDTLEDYFLSKIGGTGNVKSPKS